MCPILRWNLRKVEIRPQKVHIDWRLSHGSEPGEIFASLSVIVPTLRTAKAVNGKP